MRAYQDDAAVRDAAIARLRNHAAAGRMVRGPLSWNGDKGSLVGCLLESEDLSRWESELGLPQWLAPLIDEFCGRQASGEKALELGVTLLSAIRPGVDLVPAGGALILFALAEAAGFAAKEDKQSPKLAEALQSVDSLHRRGLQGEQPAPAEWRAARRAATAVTDSFPEGGGLQRALASCVETAAWDPSTSRSVVFDTLRVWQQANTAHIEIESGWTPEKDKKIRARLQEMFDTHLKDDPELQKTTDVFMLLAQYYPEDELELRNKNKQDKAAFAAADERACKVLLEQLKSA